MFADLMFEALPAAEFRYVSNGQICARDGSRPDGRHGRRPRRVLDQL
jgi:hypothetical protein